MMPMVEEPLEEIREEVEHLSLEVIFPLHVPLQLEDAFLDSVEDVLDDHLVVCGVAGKLEVLGKDMDEG